MFLLKDVKKIKTYYNGLIPGTRDMYDIRFSRFDGKLLAVMQISGNTVKISIDEISSKEEDEDFINYVVPFEEFYEKLGLIKGVKEIDFTARGENLYLITEEEEFEIEATIIKSREFVGEKIAEVNIEDLLYAFSLNTATAKMGISDFDNNIVLTTKRNKLFLNSYTIGAFIGNELENHLEDALENSFLIHYSNSGFLKKWLKYAGNPKNTLEDLIELSIMNSFMELKIDHLSMIFEIEFDDKLSDVFLGIHEKEYEEMKEVKFDALKKVVSAANKRKDNFVKFEEFDIDASLYRPLLGDIVFHFFDYGFDVSIHKINSKFDTLLFKAETHNECETKVLTFLKSNN